jgi:putative transposase
VKARIAHAHPNTNQGKLEKLAALQAVYRAYVQTCIDAMVVAKHHYVKLADSQVFFPKSIGLSSQLQKCARLQAVYIVSTWTKTLYRRLKRYIYEQDFTREMRVQLNMIGKCLLTQAKKTGTIVITEEALSTWWSWVWDKDIAGNTPVVGDDCPMWLSEMCIEFAPAKQAGSHGGWWARVSCLDNGKRLSIPLAKTPYLTNPTKMAKSVLIGKRHGRWTFQFTDKTPAVEFAPTTKRIGVDVGLNVLAATSDGRLLGKQCKPKFDRLYAKVMRLRKNRMRQGLRRNSPRLARMEQHLSGLIKTETGTVARKLVETYPNTTFVIENLDLRGCRGSKRFAYQALHHALENRAPTQGENPAYTSQECPSCTYVNKLNRNGTKFRCRSCGRIAHADVVGGINLLGRSEDKQIGAFDHPKVVAAILRERYRQRRDSSSGRKRSVPTVVPVVYCDARGSHGDEHGHGINVHET